jgi:acyl carrier protein
MSSEEVVRESLSADVVAQVAQVWTELLSPTDPIAPESNFFDLGGDSLAIMVMLYQVEERLGVAIPQWQLTSRPTFHGFCELVSAGRAGSTPSAVQ